MGGGGAGGGGNGRGGNGNGGDQGASGSNGGNGAGPDGRGAGSCGPGSGAGCPNPAHGSNGGTTAGDPVDVMTGRVFTRPSVDLRLPGPLPLVLLRSYSSYARERDIGLGHGWSHSLAWEVELRRRSVRLWKDDGRYEDIEALAVNTETLVAGHVLRRLPAGFVLVDGARRERVFHEIVAGSKRFLLRCVRDGYGNRIELDYDATGRLLGVTDCVGRRIRVRRHPNGRIAAFEVLNAPSQGRWVPFFRYAYDSQGDLVEATDPRGFTTRFSYVDHLLTSETAPSGRTTHHVYDSRRRCIETWVDYPGGADPSLDAAIPDTLADRVTKAKGVLHCRMTYDDGHVEVVTSREVRRYETNDLGKCRKAVVAGGVSTNSYDRWGNLVQHTDPLQATWTWQRDEKGRITMATDPLGAVFLTSYDERGFISELTDPFGRTIRYLRNDQGDVLAVRDDLGPLLENAYDGRGNWVEATLPDGGKTRMAYDPMGNRTSITEPNGGTRYLRYDHLGTLVSSVDENGRETRYSHDERGNLTVVHNPDGTSVRFSYDADGHVASITTAAGRTFLLYWAGYDVVHELRRPDGRRVCFRYDREGDRQRARRRGPLRRRRSPDIQANEPRSRGARHLRRHGTSGRDRPRGSIADAFPLGPDGGGAGAIPARRRGHPLGARRHGAIGAPAAPHDA
ncbi:DUF6531 domain-containing protein [Sorangium sp. So ce1024]|uniref:DUF6531 domain-containing protein n=1 Tax=Sorangium sp. So ce1024 TaxID=3133327 RepID=UPI003F120321